MNMHQIATSLALLSDADFSFIVTCLSDPQMGVLNEFDEEFPLRFWQRAQELSNAHLVSRGLRYFIGERYLQECQQPHARVA